MASSRRPSHAHLLHRQGAEANVKTLNYAPGPLDTDMQKNFREGLLDPKLRAAFQDMHAKVRLASAGRAVPSHGNTRC